VIYADNRTFQPDSAGVNVQLDTTLFPNSNSPLGARFNARIGVQYTAYTEFNGAGRNFDGLGANAHDNNAVRIFIWAADQPPGRVSRLPATPERDGRAAASSRPGRQPGS
jgi:hypothetical protein